MSGTTAPPSPPVILDLGVDGAIWIHREGIWVTDEDSLELVLENLRGRNYHAGRAKSVFFDRRAPYCTLAVAYHDEEYHCKSCKEVATHGMACANCYDPHPLLMSPADISVFGPTGLQTRMF